MTVGPSAPRACRCTTGPSAGRAPVEPRVPPPCEGGSLAQGEPEGQELQFAVDLAVDPPLLFQRALLGEVTPPAPVPPKRERVDLGRPYAARFRLCPGGQHATGVGHAVPRGPGCPPPRPRLLRRRGSRGSGIGNCRRAPHQLAAPPPCRLPAGRPAGRSDTTRTRRHRRAGPSRRLARKPPWPGPTDEQDLVAAESKVVGHRDADDVCLVADHADARQLHSAGWYRIDPLFGCLGQGTLPLE